MSNAPFADRARFDARDKVLGRAAFTADVPLPGMLHAMTVPATIAKGSVIAVDVREAMAVRGVVRVLTASDFRLAPGSPRPGEGPGSAAPPATIDGEVAYRGAPVALVVAETLEAAIEGAEAVRVTYAQAPHLPRIDSAGATSTPKEPVRAGDAARAMAGAATVVDVAYESPAQHHNPMELLATTAVWSGGRLTIYEATQGSQMVKAAVARALSIDPAVVDVKSDYVGGGFGQKSSTQRQTAIVARAAMLIGRPVKLVMPRGQIFHNATFRPLSRHHVRIGADAAGRMIAVEYDADHQQSRTGRFPPDYHESQPQMYGIADYLGTSADVRIDTQDPGFMRAPHPHPASFAFEGAVDELAHRLGSDSVAFRLAHDTRVDPLTGHPLSSRFLNECLTEGARRIGWDRRDAIPGSIRLPDGTLVGLGVGCGAYPAITSANIAKLRVSADGSTRFALSGHEMGQGIRTVVAAILLRDLAVDPAKLEIRLGDTAVVPQHVTAGSWGTASAIPVAEAAAARLKAAMAELLAGREIAGDLHRQLAALKRPFLDVEVSNLAPGQDRSAFDEMRASGFAMAGPAYPRFTSFSYVAHFAEVRVNPRTGRIWVPRVVSVADCGRVVSPRTAESQLRGGVVWAIGAALREESEVDPRYGGWLNNDFADYPIPVSSDIGDLEVALIDRPDPLLNATGSKGLGEVAMVGAAAAVANGVFNATGRRIRRMPIRLEHML